MGVYIQVKCSMLPPKPKKSRKKQTNAEKPFLNIKELGNTLAKVSGIAKVEIDHWARYALLVS